MHPSSYNDTGATSTTTPVINESHVKCNQVIYKASAKACDITVRGRCTDFLENSMMGGAGGVGGNKNGRGYLE
jgi:hypothetical protein